MANFKNIRIKMKSGKNRTQRVKVLASGKYKFVKNIGKKSPASRTRTKTRRKGVRRMARRKKRRGGKSFTQTAFKWLRIGSLAAPGVAIILEPGIANKEKAERFVEIYSGYNPHDQTWKWESLAKGWMPYVGTCLATYGIPKLVSIIRRL